MGKRSELHLREQSTGNKISIKVDSTNISNVLHFIDWIKSNNRGKIVHPIQPYLIECATDKDFTACRLKAKKLNLIQSRIKSNTDQNN